MKNILYKSIYINKNTHGCSSFQSVHQKGFSAIRLSIFRGFASLNNSASNISI